MRFSFLLLVGVASLISASPAPLPQGTGTGADSCASEALDPATWTKLKIDDFLATAAKNYTKTKTNNVQSLAASFGAPNFFCGLDNFCNAGQPCLPIQLPAWYAAIAIQNWNNYMNSLNTAITFASSIVSLKLGQIVTDVYPDPKDDITPLKTIGTVFGAILGAVPFTGTLATTTDAVNKGLAFVLSRASPPAVPDKFLAWTNLASSMGDILQEYQATISTSIKNSLDAEVDDPTNGINVVIKGGDFLGVSQNFTQSDLQKVVIDSITMNAIGLALQAQKIFIGRFTNAESCRDDAAADLCSNGDGGGTTKFSMLKRTGEKNATPQDDIAQTLMDKYGMTKEQMLKGPTECFDTNGQKQLVNPLEQGGIPADPKAPCVYNLLVCDVPQDPTGRTGIIEACTTQKGLDL